MAAGLNSVHIIGNVAADAEVHTFQSGAIKASFRVGVSESYKDKNTGEQRDSTDWINVVCWGKQAEIAAQYVKKGMQIFVDGKMQTESWDKDGEKRYKTFVNCRNFQFLGKRENHGGESDSDRQYREDEERRARYAAEAEADFDLGDLGPPLDMDDDPQLSPGD